LKAFPTVSVIVPVYNGEQTIGACLTALFQGSYPAFEVIVVDDGSVDAKCEIAAAFPCRLIRGEHAGAAAARNLGAEYANATILFFVDADVLVQPDSIGRMVSAFEDRPDIRALFGSFEKNTTPNNFVTMYKNLRHHYTHQTADENAATFCSGFGAIYCDTFLSIGGFDPQQQFLEDIEIGYRLHRAGVSIALRKDLQFTHCKAYTLGSLIRSDLFGRAVPWTRLMLSARIFRNDLNTRAHNVASVPVTFVLAAALLFLLATLFGFTVAGPLAIVVGAALAFVWLNWRFLAFLKNEKGTIFAVKSAFLLGLGYLYSGLGFAIGGWQHLRTRGTAAARERCAS